MGVFAQDKIVKLKSRIAMVAAAFALLALMAAAAGCESDEEPVQPTDAPPTATAEMPDPTATQEPSVAPDPTATDAPTAAPIAAPTPTSAPALPPATPQELAATPAADLPTVREILDAVAVAQAAVETGSVTLQGTASLGGDPNLKTELVLSGDFQAPDRSQFTTIITASGISLEYDSIVIGEDGYQENLFTGGWEASQDARSILGESGYLGELDLDFDEAAFEEITLVGVEELGGVQVYRMQGTLPADAAAEMTGDSSLSEGTEAAPFEVSLWTGVEDSLIRRISLSFQDTDALSGQTIIGHTVMTYSDYGKVVDIQAPEVLQPVYSIPLPGGLDDHGNDQASATELAVGEPVDGVVDDLFDFDFFAFSAEQGQTYLMEVALGTLTDSALGLYDSTGNQEAWNNDFGDSTLSRIEWTASASGDFFISVEGYGVDSSGTYTLALSLVTGKDDHGSDPASATAIMLDGVVRGEIDNAMDYDYFAFQADEGQDYWVDVQHITLTAPAVRVYDSQGNEQELTYDDTITQASHSTWTAPAPGDYFIAVKSGDGSAGSYLLRIGEVQAAQPV